MTEKKQKGLSLNKLTQISNELHQILCEAIITLLQEDLKDHGITKEELKAAREFAEVKPNTEVAKKLLEFLESKEIK